MTKSKGTKEAGRKQFTIKEYRLLCDWLEIEGNLESIFGVEGKTKVGVRYQSKKLAFEAMADYVNERQLKGSTLAKIDFQGVKNRFNHLNGKYKKAKQLADSTGFGLTEADIADGIMTIEAKLETLCPCYGRMEIIFGHKPIVDTARNLYTSTLTEDNGTEQADFLKELESGVTRGPGDELQDPMDEAPLEVEGNPTTPVGVPTSGSGIDGSSMPNGPSPAIIGQGPESMAPNFDKEDTSSAPPTGGTNQPPADGTNQPMGGKQKGQRGPPYTTNKKRPLQKHTSFTNTFASSMETLSQGKLRSLELKEKVMEQRSATQALRAETAKQQFEFSQQLETHRLQLEERKINTDAERQAASIRAAKVQARLDIIRMNSNRSPQELETLIAFIENVD